MEKKYHCLYQIVNKINGMIYIGIHSTNNLFDDYMGSGKRIKAAIKEYGKENFTKYIIGLYDTKCEMISAEVKIVNHQFALREDTYNIAKGGNSGNPFGHSDEAKQNMSLAQTKRFKDNPYPEETKIKQAKTLYGRPLSEEHKKAIGDGNRGKIRPPVSEETKQKQSDALKGREFSKEHKDKLSEASKNKKPPTEEARQNMSKAWEKRRLMPISEETRQKKSDAAKKCWENPEYRNKFTKNK